MRIDIFFTPDAIDELQLRDKNVVIVDVLRASTTIVTALANGAKEIIPVSSVESAVKISGNLFGDVILLGGERNGKLIEGFNLSNSPQEYTEEVVKNKSIIFSTTNGSQAMVKSRYAKNLVIGCFINVSKVVEFIREINSDFSIICAGKQGSFCIEDAVCAGMIIQKLSEANADDLSLSDAALASLTLHKNYEKNILNMIKKSEHGQYLSEIGFGDDLKICAGIDTCAVLPILSGNVIRLRKEIEKKEASPNEKAGS
ncbi:MAG: 2-phosphosulfolactate phosphatase [Bacteroidota bacterium]